MPAALLVDHLSKTYIKKRSLREMVTHPLRRAARIEALRGIDLEVRPGEIFGLLGPNGAGKTTLLKILACLVLPTEGRALVNGIDVAREEETVKRSIGFVTSDERSFYWRLTGRENLHFFARLYGLDAAGSRTRTQKLLEQMDLTEIADRQFMSYSSGMKQRLAIARALLHDPPILCLDEPTRSLDPIGAKNLRRFVSGQLNVEHGKTILLATHNLQEAEDMCHRLAILDRGRILHQGTVAGVTEGITRRDHYVITVSGGGEMPLDPRWEIRIERDAGEPLRVFADVDRGGEALSALLRAILNGQRTILSCTLREPGLQEVFDLMDSPGEDTEESAE